MGGAKDDHRIWLSSNDRILFPLFGLIFAYVVGAHCYEPTFCNTPLDWLSITFWLSEASCDDFFMTWVALLVHSRRTVTLTTSIKPDGGGAKEIDHSIVRWANGRKVKMRRPLVILFGMFVAQSSLNSSFPDSVFYSCRSSTWRWLVVHALYSLYFSTIINGLIYCVSFVINFWELFDNQSVQYHQRFQGQERVVAIQRGYRRLKLFLFQLIVLSFAYVLGAYYYKSVVRSTSVDWPSFARWLIEASCDYLNFTSILVSMWQIPASTTELNNHFAILSETLLVIKTNQFVMMRYAEFHSCSCLNTIRVVIFYFFCPKRDDHSWDRILTACLMSDEHLSDWPQWLFIWMDVLCLFSDSSIASWAKKFMLSVKKGILLSQRSWQLEIVLDYSTMITDQIKETQRLRVIDTERMRIYFCCVVDLF